MEEKEIEKSVISEEALDDIAGGINVDKSTLKKILISAGVAIAGAGAIATAGGAVGYHLGKKRGRKLASAEPEPESEVEAEAVDW